MAEKSPFEQPTAVVRADGRDGSDCADGLDGRRDTEERPTVGCVAAEPVTGTEKTVPRGAEVEWYVDLAGQAHGPITQSDVARLISERRVGLATHVWQPEFSGWQRLSEVAVLAQHLPQVDDLSGATKHPAEAERRALSWEEQPTQVVVDADLDVLDDLATPAAPLRPRAAVRPPPLPQPPASHTPIAAATAKPPAGWGNTPGIAQAVATHDVDRGSRKALNGDWWQTNRLPVLPEPAGPHAEAHDDDAGVADPANALNAVAPDTGISPEGSLPQEPSAIAKSSATLAGVVEPLITAHLPRQGSARRMAFPDIGIFTWVGEVSARRSGLLALILGSAAMMIILVLVLALVLGRQRIPVDAQPVSETAVTAVGGKAAEEPDSAAAGVVSLKREGKTQTDPTPEKMARRQALSRPTDKKEKAASPDALVNLRRAPRATASRAAGASPRAPRRLPRRAERPAEVRSEEEILDQLLAGTEEALPAVAPRRRPPPSREPASREQAAPPPPKRAPPDPQADAYSSRVPATLSPSDIRSTMRQLHPRVQRCFEQHRETGTVSLQITVQPSGMARAAVVGEFRDRPTGRCIADGVDALRFPAFSGEPMTFVYPFRLRAE